MSKADSVFVLTPTRALSVFSSRILSRDSGRRPRRSVFELFERLNFSSGDEIEPDDQNFTASNDLFGSRPRRKTGEFLGYVPR